MKPTAVKKAKSSAAQNGRTVRRAGGGDFAAPEGKGLVDVHIHKELAAKNHLKVDAAALIETVRQGLPVAELEKLRSALAMPIEQVAAKVGMSKATFHRRKAQGKLSPDESDKVLRFARLMGHAIRVFGGYESARQWLNSPQRGLGGSVPVDYAETEVGAREVENLLGRIEYGVYS